MIMRCNYKQLHNYFYKRISTFSEPHFEKVVYIVLVKVGIKTDAPAPLPFFAQKLLKTNMDIEK